MASHYDLTYTLSDEEALRGLRVAGAYKSLGKRGIIENIIVGLLIIYFLVVFIMYRQPVELVMFFLCIAVIVALNVIPRRSIKKQAASAIRDLRIKIYPAMIYVYGQGNEKGDVTKIEIGESKIRYNKKDKLTTVETKDKELLIIPDRAIPKEVSGRVRAILSAEKNNYSLVKK